MRRLLSRVQEISFSLLLVGLLFFFTMPAGVEALSLCPNFCVSGLEKNDLITSGHHPGIYFYSGLDRRPFATGEVFKTYYENYNLVKTLSVEDIEKIPLGTPMPISPGLWLPDSRIRLLKFPLNPRVYYVDTGGVLRHIENEQTAAQFFGDDWDKKIITLPEIYSLFYIKGYTLGNSNSQVSVRVANESTSTWITRVEIRKLNSSDPFFGEVYAGDGAMLAQIAPPEIYQNTVGFGSVLLDKQGEIEVVVTRYPNKILTKKFNLKTLTSLTDYRQVSFHVSEDEIIDIEFSTLPT